MDILAKLARSWSDKQGKVETTEQILDWIHRLNQDIEVKISRTSFQKGDYWYYDEESGSIVNQGNSFFSVTGIKVTEEGAVVAEQPIILQDEIGYLGIICQEIGGALHFLMQAKIEPGNVNKIQISPTIQATKSNFTQKHGGKRPAYLDYFMNASRYRTIVDQIQSEQSSRFFRKRNRNIIIEVDAEETVEALPSHKWMTLGQIKELMKTDNLVNMDTRTVLSCIPFSVLACSDAERQEIKGMFSDQALYRSVFAGSGENVLPKIYQYMNDYKMFRSGETEFCPLKELQDWEITDAEIYCKKEYPFKVIYCDIMIEGREVRHWKQPLFEAIGQAFFGLFCCKDEGALKFLVSARPEIGCFDGIELGPTVQMEAGRKDGDSITEFFWKKYEERKGIRHDVILSEEGGRFYHEQNRNVIIQTEKSAVPSLPEGYFWIDYYTLNHLVQVNNCLNIQLRNLLSLLEV